MASARGPRGGSGTDVVREQGVVAQEFSHREGVRSRAGTGLGPRRGGDRRSPAGGTQTGPGHKPGNRAGGGHTRGISVPAMCAGVPAVTATPRAAAGSLPSAPERRGPMSSLREGRVRTSTGAWYGEPMAVHPRAPGTTNGARQPVKSPDLDPMNSEAPIDSPCSLSAAQ